MITISDFADWLDQVELEDYDEIDSLYRTVDSLSNYGIFLIAAAKGVDNGWILTAEFCDAALHIQSEKARKTFLSLIETRYCEGMSEEAWYDFHRSMQKND